MCFFPSRKDAKTKLEASNFGRANSYVILRLVKSIEAIETSMVV